MSGKIHIEMFSEERIALLKEIDLHPALVADILEAGIDIHDYGELIGHVAGYCNVEMDGMYTPADLDRAADGLYWKLRAVSAVVTHGRLQ